MVTRPKKVDSFFDFLSIYFRTRHSRCSKKRSIVILKVDYYLISDPAFNWISITPFAPLDP